MFSLDSLKACGGVENAKEMMSMEQVLQMRSPNNYIYFDFINHFVSAVVGKTKHKSDSHTRLLSKFATVSDEAFALLSLEINYDTWMDIGVTSDTKTSRVHGKYTNGGKSQLKIATSQHNRGWSDEALRRFNESFDMVEKKEHCLTPENLKRSLEGSWKKNQRVGRRKKQKEYLWKQFKFVTSYGMTMRMKEYQLYIVPWNLHVRNIYNPMRNQDI